MPYQFFGSQFKPQWHFLKPPNVELVLPAVDFPGGSYTLANPRDRQLHELSRRLGWVQSEYHGGAGWNGMRWVWGLGFVKWNNREPLRVANTIILFPCIFFPRFYVISLMDSSILVKYLWFTAVRGLARKTLVTFWWCLDGGGGGTSFLKCSKKSLPPLTLGPVSTLRKWKKWLKPKPKNIRLETKLAMVNPPRGYIFHQSFWMYLGICHWCVWFV